MCTINLARQTSASQSGRGSLARTATTTYDDVNLAATTTQSDTSSNLVITTNYDPLGRVRLTTDGDGHKVAMAYRFGSGQRYVLQSNPYGPGSMSGSTAGWTLTTLDSVGRTVEVDHYLGATPPAPWGSNTTKTGAATVAYDQNISGCTGPVTETTDEAGNTHWNCTDGLDRLVSVTEPNPSSGAQGTVTNYTYDFLNNLQAVDVAGQSNNYCRVNGVSHGRCFVYSTLSRLLQASNPESGTTYYAYDNNGNLLTRTDANGSVTSMGAYDGLDRPAGVTYAVGQANNPAVTTASVSYTYDGGGFKGALSGVSNAASGTTYAYDGFGRISASTQTTASGPNSPYHFTYGYSLTDQLTSMTYPSGRQVNYSLDAADRVTTVQNVTGGGNYAGSIGYTADGGITGMMLGASLQQSLTWNDRLQPTGIAATGTGGSLLSLGFFPCTGNATSCASTGNSGNNGNLQSQTIVTPGLNLTQSYSYDKLNRLTAATESGGGSSWTQNYQYDVFGNKAVTQNTGLPALTNQTPQSTGVYSTTVPNRIASWGYDNNGNVLAVGGVALGFTYDAENREVSATLNSAVSGYTYDGNGQRVQKTTGGVTTTYVYDAFGNLAAEYSSAVLSSPCGVPTCYVTSDHLGSTRMMTDGAGSSGSVVRYDYQPFGQEISASYDGRTTGMGYLSSPDGFTVKFTGQARDQETAEDYFLARYYDPQQGRFQSVDPGNAGADLGNPQSWNGYGYVGNNPMSYVDPSGMLETTATGAEAGAFICGPVCAGIGAAVGAVIDGFIAWDILGGGPPPTIPPALATPSSPMQPNGYTNCDPTQSSCSGIGSTVGGGGVGSPFSISLFALLAPRETLDRLATGGGTSYSSGRRACTAEPLRIPLVITTQFGAVDASHSTPHGGRDYRAPIGTPVYAPESGTVAFAGPANTAGNAAVVRSPSVNSYLYHLSGFAVSAGQQVAAGTLIGYSGNTGHSTGPHLHFEQHIPGPIWLSGAALRVAQIDPCY